MNTTTGKCVSCGIDHCQNCTKASSCDKCMDGYYVTRSGTPARTKCVACLANCLICESNVTCDKCMDTFYFNVATKKC